MVNGKTKEYFKHWRKKIQRSYLVKSNFKETKIRIGKYYTGKTKDYW